MTSAYCRRRTADGVALAVVDIPLAVRLGSLFWCTTTPLSRSILQHTQRPSVIVQAASVCGTPHVLLAAIPALLEIAFLVVLVSRQIIQLLPAWLLTVVRAQPVAI